MPEIGEVKSGSEIGKSIRSYYTYKNCVDCKQPRWVMCHKDGFVKEGEDVRCNACNRKKLGKRIYKIAFSGTIEHPDIGDIRIGRELGFNNPTSKFIWASCLNCGKQRWVAYIHCKADAKYCKQCAGTNHKKGADNENWKGDNAGYSALHQYVRKIKIKTKECEICHQVKPLDLANVSGKYKRDVKDWLWLCKKCHIVQDGRIYKIGIHSKTKLLTQEQINDIKQSLINCRLGTVTFLARKYKLSRETIYKINGAEPIWGKSKIIRSKSHNNNGKGAIGEHNHRWTGDNPSYSGIHSYIKYYKPRPTQCSCCEQEKRLDLCNISGKYLRDLNDWEWLCRKCHMTKDGRLDKLHKKLLK